MCVIILVNQEVAIRLHFARIKVSDIKFDDSYVTKEPGSIVS